jgi:hypothetical protein
LGRSHSGRNNRRGGATFQGYESSTRRAVLGWRTKNLGGGDGSPIDGRGKWRWRDLLPRGLGPADDISHAHLSLTCFARQMFPANAKQVKGSSIPAGPEKTRIRVLRLGNRLLLTFAIDCRAPGPSGPQPDPRAGGPANRVPRRAGPLASAERSPAGPLTRTPDASIRHG